MLSLNSTTLQQTAEPTKRPYKTSCLPIAHFQEAQEETVPQNELQLYQFSVFNIKVSPRFA